MRILIHVFLLTVATALSAWAQAFENSVVVVRLKAGTPTANGWMQQQRSTELPAFTSLLGEHLAVGFLTNQSLIGLERARRKQTNSNNSQQQNELSLIARVSYKADIPPLVAASKLSSHPDVVYAEPLPIDRIVIQPDDSLVIDQYHLPLVKAFDAWDVLPTVGTIVVGIVDTGIDTTHPDIGANIWRNAGEVGIDANKLDKRFNGVDDDGNGFVDDWFGWDFAGVDGNSPDNTPLPGHVHGTHVGGIVAAVSNNKIGVSGVGIRIVLMPVKVAVNSAASVGVVHTADAIIYAASNGAKVINCSFGSPSKSFASQEVIAAATNLGALVVGAAGNESVDQAFYPASYPEVVSVSATNWSDKLASFSNIHSSVDVSAPGVGILSTIPNSQYAMFDGTSMAAPVVAAVAAMHRFANPTSTPQQTLAYLKANTDNIDSTNPFAVGRIGTGRVNAFKTVTKANRQHADVTGVVPIDDNNDGVIAPGERVSLQITVQNILDSCTNLSIEVSGALFHFSPIFIKSSSVLGSMQSGESKQVNDISLIIPDSLSFNADLGLFIVVKENDVIIGRQLSVFTVNPSYVTIQSNNINVTVNSRGNIAYNDFPSNVQGIGFGYKSLESILFEGGLMVAKNPVRVPNVVRGANPSLSDTSFTARFVVVERKDSAFAGSVVTCSYTDQYEIDKIGIDVVQRVYQPSADSVQDVIIMEFNISNPSDTTIENIYASYFTDWDIGPMGDANGCAWDHALGNGLVQNTQFLSYPTIAMSMISPLTINFFALDNGGSADSPSIYDQFLRSEKWRTMTAGIGRTNSSITDVSMVIGGGPFNLAPRASQQICFIIGAGARYADVAKSIESGRNLAIGMGLNASTYKPTPLQDRILHVEGSPTLGSGESSITFQIQKPSGVTFDIVDLFGRTVQVIMPTTPFQGGTYTQSFLIPSVAGASYFIRMLTASTTAVFPIAMYR